MGCKVLNYFLRKVIEVQEVVTSQKNLYFGRNYISIHSCKYLSHLKAEHSCQGTTARTAQPWTAYSWKVILGKLFDPKKLYKTFWDLFCYSVS